MNARKAFTITTLLATIITLYGPRPAHAGQLNSPGDCVVGNRVTTSDGHKGKITRVDRDWSYCYVLQDDTGKTVGYLYSLLSTEGPAGGGNDKQLVVGKYDCWVGSQAAGGMRITSPSTYESDGKKGTFHVEPSRKIVFESGPFSTFNAKLLAGPRIGMNMNGGTFYNMTCEPGK